MTQQPASDVVRKAGAQIKYRGKVYVVGSDVTTYPASGYFPATLLHVLSVEDETGKRESFTLRGDVLIEVLDG
jgi:hypothetical protein